jgi:hypothetical protein
MKHDKLYLETVLFRDGDKIKGAISNDHPSFGEVSFTFAYPANRTGWYDCKHVLRYLIWVISCGVAQPEIIAGEGILGLHVDGYDPLDSGERSAERLFFSACFRENRNGKSFF